MLSDDIFKSQLKTAIAAIEEWARPLAAVAAIDTARDAEIWRIAARPHVPEACPVELSLRSDQRFDLMVGPESYEDQTIERLDAMLPMLRAVAAGHVLTRTTLTAATGLPLEVASLLLSDDGVTPLWRQARSLPTGRLARAVETVVRDHHYAPYARGA